jgi:hypothetical protein
VGAYAPRIGQEGRLLLECAQRGRPPAHVKLFDRRGAQLLDAPTHLFAQCLEHVFERAPCARHSRPGASPPLPRLVLRRRPWRPPTVQRPELHRGQQIWEISINPCFLGGDALDMPPLHAPGEAAATTWLRFLSEVWLGLADEN